IGTSAGDWTADPQPLTLRAGVTSSVTLTFRKNSTLAVTANFVNNVQSVGLGLGTSYVVTDGGLLESGLSSATRTFTRMSFTAFDTTSVPTNAIAALAAGYDAACAARQDGTVWCWGQNHFGELGPAGTIGSTSPTPLQVTGISAVTQIAAGAYHFCVIGKYGAATMPAVYCWGRGDRGQLGNGAMTSSATPQQANVLSTVRSIACGGDSTYLVDTTGAAFGWGYNGYGQLGDATTTSHSAPTAANRGLVQSIAGGDGHSCGLRFDGIVSCVGQNADGQLGNGTTMNTGASFAINGLVAKQVATGGFSTCAITTAGQTLCWGRGAEGEIGNGNSSGRTTPGPLAPDAPAFTSVAVGFQHACGLTAASDLYCWGANANGQVGDGTVNYAFVPVKAQLQ
ncbi:MAG TPA: hypothetical protein VGQ57_07010, partial [Polyangiaceae bacterium]|nr:hypothetical protein [Polyangiaceae bacterium]